MLKLNNKKNYKKLWTVMRIISILFKKKKDKMKMMQIQKK